MQPVLLVGVLLAVSYGPAAGYFIGFVEPAVQDAQVQHAVDAGLHAAGAAGFLAALRSVQPQVYALHHFARDLHVVVLPVARKLHDIADEILALVVARVRLAGDHDLHRHILVTEDALDAVHVLEQQGGAFIGGEPARKADSQRVGIQHLFGMPHLRRRSLSAQRRRALPLAHEIHQAALAAAMHFQQFLVRNLFDLLPDAGVGQPVAPVRLQIPIIERRQVPVEPACQVHAVGHRADRHFPDRQWRPQVVPQFLRDVAMQLAHRIAVRGRFQRQDGHRKPLLAIGRIAAPQRHQLVEVDPDVRAIGVEVVIHQARIEQVDSGRHRRVRSEDVARAGGL